MCIIWRLYLQWNTGIDTASWLLTAQKGTNTQMKTPECGTVGGGAESVSALGAQSVAWKGSDMSNKRGAVAESIVVTRALERGRDVLVPVRGLTPPYDITVRGVDGDFHKVQIKRLHTRVRGSSRTLRANITDSKGNAYSSSDVDIIAVVDVDTHRVWFLPLSELGTQKTVSLTSGKYDRWLL
jgi:hypothetical protein